MPESGQIGIDFDRRFLDAFLNGRIESFLRYPKEKLEAEAGPGGHEIRTWITIAGAAAGTHGSLLAYQPVPAWSTGCAVAVLEIEEAGCGTLSVDMPYRSDRRARSRSQGREKTAMRVYEAIGETLKKLEVRATFGLMGDGNLRFMTHLAHELDMPYYAARHEGGAVAMADGYARVTGQVGVCSVTQGPGVTNTLTALTEARKAGTPMLLLAGDTAARILRHNQDVDQTAIFKSVGVTVARVRSPDTLVDGSQPRFQSSSSPAASHCDLDPYRYARAGMRDRRVTGGRWCKRRCRAGLRLRNSASRRVNRHLEAAGDHCLAEGQFARRPGNL